MPREADGSILHGGDGFDLDELVIVSEDRHAEKRAGDVVVSERVADDLPRGDEVGLPSGRNQHTSADDIVAAPHTKRLSAYPAEPGYPCYVSVLGELAWMPSRGELPQAYQPRA